MLTMTWKTVLGMVCEPGACLQATMTAQIVGNDEDVAGRVVGLNLFEQLDVIRRVARGGLRHRCTVRDRQLRRRARRNVGRVYHRRSVRLISVTANPRRV